MSHLLIVKRLELYMDLALYKINILYYYYIISPWLTELDITMCTADTSPIVSMTITEKCVFCLSFLSTIRFIGIFLSVSLYPYNLYNRWMFVWTIKLHIIYSFALAIFVHFYKVSVIPGNDIIAKAI